MADVLVVAGGQGSWPSRSTLELLSLARQVADATQGRVHTAILEGEQTGPASAFIAHGADKVWRLQHPLLRIPLPDLSVAALASVATQVAPQVLLLADDPAGKEVGPRLAYRLGGAVVTEVTAAETAGGAIFFRRQMYGGRALAVIEARRFPVVATVKPRSLAAATEDPGRSGEEIAVRAPLDASLARTRIRERVAEEVRGVKLENARVVVSGGRGLKGPEPFTQLEEVAQLLKGAVGASRAATDAGWVPASRQVGQTGKTVSPDLYIAVGISGATQHLAGMSSAKTILAINTDPDAPIFKVAHLGVVGDFKAVLPAFIAKCRS